MRKLWVVLALTIFSLTGVGNAPGQTPAAGSTAQQGTDPGITPNGVLGEVAAVDAGAKQMFVKTDAGSVVVVVLSDAVVFKRIPPGETTLSKATDITLSDVGAGDRVLARGKPSDDRKTVLARMVIVMTKADITQKQEAERAEWRKRGIVGVITALNPQTKEITLQTRGGAGAGNQPVVIPVTPGVKLRRYAPDSVKFSDAKPSTFEELKVGDQLRAKGDRSPDGARFTPEEVVTGSFRTIIGTVTAVNAASNELSIKPTQGNNPPLTVVLSKDSVIKQVPAEFATTMAAMRGPGGPGAGGAPGAPGAGGQGQGGGQRRMGDMQEMLERLPSINVADLKPGSMVVFSTTGTGQERVTAIQLVSGIEPIVAMMQSRPGAGGRGPGGAGGAGGAGGGGLPGFGFGIGTP